MEQFHQGETLTVPSKLNSNFAEIAEELLLIMQDRGYINTKLAESKDFNDILLNGRYRITDATANLPDSSTVSTFLIDVVTLNSSYVYQMAYCAYSNVGNTGKAYVRSSSNGAWTAWQEFAMTSAGVLTLLNNWVVDLGTTAISKNGKAVTLNAVLRNGTYTNGTVIANLPVGFRPTSQRYCIANSYNASYTASPFDVIIGTDGNLVISGTANGNTRLVIQLTFTI